MQIAALVVVVLHVLVLIAHDLAHRNLGISLAPWQLLFVYLVIVAAPVGSVVAVFTRFAGSGFVLLAISMLSSLAFTVYHHYVLISPDHVLHLPAGNDQHIFQITAVAMVLLELAGVVVAVFALRGCVK